MIIKDPMGFLVGAIIGFIVVVALSYTMVMPTYMALAQNVCENEFGIGYEFENVGVGGYVTCVKKERVDYTYDRQEWPPNRLNHYDEVKWEEK